MVVKISKIPPYIQKQVYEKMDFSDFRRFRQSSKHGRDSGGIAKPTMDISYLLISADSEKLKLYKFIDDGDEEKQICKWPEAKLQPNCPRFNPGHICAFYVKNERGMEIIEEVESEHFSFKRKYFRFYQHVALDFDTFARLLKVFDVTKLEFYGFNSGLYTKLPCISQLDGIITSRIADEDILALKATTIVVEDSMSENINTTLNLFLKQWLSNTRKIERLRIQLAQENESCTLDQKEIFTGIPFSTLWSKETHASSILSEISKKNLKRRERCFISSSYLALTNGTQNLYIKLYGKYEFEVTRADDPKDEVYSLLGPINYRKLTGRCKSCKLSNCNHAYNNVEFNK